MKLSELDTIKSLQFDINNRTLDVIHDGEVAPIKHLIEELNLGSTLVSTEETDNVLIAPEKNESRSLWIVLLINFVFFCIEMTFGWISHSMGLVADSLDMLADSIVYGLSLIAIGGSILLKKRVATIAGFFQLSLAILGFIEVIRRFVGVADIPDHNAMIAVSIFALLANAFCLYVLQKTRSQEAHMQASMIFTSNDIVINAGVILAGVLVLFFGTKLPDLIIGAIVFVIVLRGATRILKLAR